MEPKADIEMERKLLSALMLKSGEAVSQANEVLTENDFYRPEHRLIYRALLKLSDAGTPIDVLLVERELELSGNLKRVGRQYLFSLVILEHTTGRVPYYAKNIKELSTLRRLIEIGQELSDEAANERATSAEILASTEQKLLTAAGTNYRQIMSAQDFFAEVYENLSQPNEGLLGITTGFHYLDLLTCGLKKSDLIILAARPSMGKTALALNIAANAASEKNSVLVFSLEMSKAQVGERFVSAQSRVNASRIQKRTLTDGEWTAVTNAVENLGSVKMFIDDTAGMTLTELKTKARKIKREQGLDLIVLDYLQLLQGGKRYAGNRVEEVSEISRGLKALARELDIPILALSQLNRALEMRADKHPILSDLRDSGSIEQDADIVMFLYREEYYNRDTEKPEVAEVIIAKNRNGATGVVPLKFEKEYVLFSN